MPSPLPPSPSKTSPATRCPALSPPAPSPSARTTAWSTCLFSPERSLVRQLYAFDTATGERRLLLTPPGSGAQEENLSPEEQLRRERQRMLTLGVTHYAWAEQDQPPAGARCRTASTSRMARAPRCARWSTLPMPPPPSTRASPPMARPSPTCRTARSTWCLLPAGPRASSPTARAKPAAPTAWPNTSPRKRWVAQQGYWWSPQGDWIAFEEVDENHIPLYHIVHQGKDFDGAPVEEEHRYPFAGQANAHVRLGVIPTAGGEVTWMDLGAEPDIYLARAGWLPDGRPWAQVENREQTCLDLLTFDPQTGQSQPPAARNQPGVDQPARYVPPLERRPLCRGLHLGAPSAAASATSTCTMPPATCCAR